MNRRPLLNASKVFVRLVLLEMHRVGGFEKVRAMTLLVEEESETLCGFENERGLALVVIFCFLADGESEILCVRRMVSLEREEETTNNNDNTLNVDCQR